MSNISKLFSKFITESNLYLRSMLSQIWRCGMEFMMMFSDEHDIVREFIIRSRSNLEFLKPPQYEVTQLINSAIGLLIIPKETYYKEIQDDMIPSEILYEVKQCIFPYTYGEPQNLQNIVKHMRNGIAHGKISFEAEKSPLKSQPPHIHNIIFKDSRDSKCFKMVISVDLFRKFLVAFSDAMVLKIENMPRGRRK